MAKYKIQKTVNYQYYWTFNADNQQVIITSETYTTKASAQAGIISSKNSLLDGNFRRYPSSNNQYYFVQVANNNQPLGTSETYTTATNRDHGINVVQLNARLAGIEDYT